jgi:hypothetical protein
MARRAEIMKKALGVEYDEFETGGIEFDYEALMTKPPIPSKRYGRSRRMWASATRRSWS